MKRSEKNNWAIWAGAVIVLCGLPAAAQTPPVSGPVDTVSRVPLEVGNGRVSLEISGGTVSDALLSISKQAELQLIVTADEVDLQKSITLMVHDKPADEVLEIISDTAGLGMEMKNGVLIVRSTPSASAGANRADDVASESPFEDESTDPGHGFRSWRERFDAHQRYWKQRKKRVEFGRPVVVEKNEHLKTAVSIGDDTTIEGHVDEDAVSIGGTLTVKSGAVVERSAVSVGGRVVIEPGAVVGDDAVAVGGTVDVAEDAVLEGDRVSIGVPLPTVGGIAGAMGGILVLNFLAAIARSVVLFGLALLLLWLIPRRVETVRGYLNQKPAVSILSGFIVFLALVPLFIVLAITIVGIPLIPVAVVALVALLILGLTAVMLWIGERIPLFKKHRTPLKTLIIGFVVFMLLNIIPALGCMLLLVASFAAVGAAFQSRFGGRDLA